MAASQRLTVDDLQLRASDWAQNSWKTNGRTTLGPWGLGPMTALELNPGLRSGCPALVNYCEGYRKLDDFVDARSSTFFAWHGTPTMTNVVDICYHGFSPAKRRRQAHGTGEYFGVVAEDSHNFSGNTDRLIVVQIIKCKHVRTLHNCHVVDNPKDKKYTFTLPVLVVAYRNSALQAIPWIQGPVLPMPFPFVASQGPTVPLQQASTSTTCWQWKKDDGSWGSYNSSMTTILEVQYQSYLKGGQPSLATRHCNGGSHMHVIDFQSMTQENQLTKTRRSIRRSIRSKPEWHWMEDGNVAVPFPKTISVSIEQHYVNYMKQPFNSCTTFTTPISRRNDNTQQAYQIDFLSMTQTNQKTGYKRNVTRTVPKLSKNTAGPGFAGTVQFSTQATAEWHWMEDGNVAVPFPKTISDSIEQRYYNYAKQPLNSCTTFTTPISRRNDNTQQAYQIDFSSMTQTNQKTGYKRKVTRTVPKLSKNTAGPGSAGTVQFSTQATAEWHWMEDGNVAVPFPKTISVSIEQHYVNFAKQPFHASATFNTPNIARRNDNAQQAYQIDFWSMTQTNLKTGYKRNVTRTVPKQSKITAGPGSAGTVQFSTQAKPSGWNMGTNRNSHPALTQATGNQPTRSPQGQLLPVAQVKANVQWYWMEDGNVDVPFSRIISDSIEQRYDNYVKQPFNSGTTFTTLIISRRNDNVQQAYQIDFLSMTQTNQKTGYKRKVTRTVPKQSKNAAGPRSPSIVQPGLLSPAMPRPGNVIITISQPKPMADTLWNLIGKMNMGTRRNSTQATGNQPTRTPQGQLLPVAQVKANVQWYWMKDDGNPETYSSVETDYIEHHYQLHVCGGPQSFNLSGVVRQCDGAVQSYTITFGISMTQTNQKTNYIRQLKRSTIIQQSNVQLQQVTPVSPKASPWKWQWTKDDGTLEPFPDSVSDLIEYHYQLHVQGGPQSFSIPAIPQQCDGTLQSYIIDFSTPFTQTNRTTGHTRQVQRLPKIQSGGTSPPTTNNQTSTVGASDKTRSPTTSGPAATSEELGKASIPETGSGTSTNKISAKGETNPPADSGTSGAIHVEEATSSTGPAGQWLNSVVDLLAGVKGYFWDSDVDYAAKDCLETQSFLN